MSEALSLRNAPPEIVRVFEEACKELAAKGQHYTPDELLNIRQRQATGEIRFDDPDVTVAESPTRSVRVKQQDGTFEDMTFKRDHTPGLSPLDSAVRKMRSAAYAFNSEDYTACAIMAKEAFLEVQAALRDKTFMDVSVEIVPQDKLIEPSKVHHPEVIEVKDVKEIEGGDGAIHQA